MIAAGDLHRAGSWALFSSGAYITCQIRLQLPQNRICCSENHPLSGRAAAGFFSLGYLQEWAACLGKIPCAPGTSVPGRSPDITTMPLLEVIQLLKYFCNFSQGLVCPYPGERELKVLFKRKGTEGSFLFHWVGSGEFNISVFWE